MNKNEILNFIDQRFGYTNANGLDGNCYGFAVILINRFPDLQIYYDQIDGHFVAGDGTNFYDGTGQLASKLSYQLLSDIQTNDELLYNRLVRDCIN